jgi:hypothetical protein
MSQPGIHGSIHFGAMTLLAHKQTHAEHFMLNDYSASCISCDTELTIHIQHQEMQFVILYILTHTQWHRQGGVSSVAHHEQPSQNGGKLGNKINILNGKKIQFSMLNTFSITSTSERKLNK